MSIVGVREILPRTFEHRFGDPPRAQPEAELRVTISGNRPVFNLGLAATLTNTINRAPYLGGGPFTWMCAGISGSPQSEVVDGQEIEYYSFVTELIYRESSHLLFIPNVGWNYLENASAEADANEAAPTNRPPAAGTAIVTARLPRTSSSGIKKKRAYVEDESGERIASSNPVALNANGSLKGQGLAPDVLVRRVNRAVNFSQFFGTPVRAIF
jgi:hypothetical protein